jgi:hypothetical protein
MQPEIFWIGLDNRLKKVEEDRIRRRMQKMLEDKSDITRLFVGKKV